MDVLYTIIHQSQLVFLSQSLYTTLSMYQLPHTGPRVWHVDLPTAHELP